MGKRRTQIFLIITILSFLLLFPTYSRYVSLSEIVLFHVDLNFGNPDQDDQLDGQQYELGALLSSLVSPNSFLEEADFIERSHLLSFLLASHFQNGSILRC